ncbi:4Fe-4S cluster-binding domain-containing protein [Lawsonia intracellularis]|uniref:4Fe-4S cluster-binding domain-containing protein n=1 Tax=Lawsonia intracellularis TaxID=29546 RepID=UPI001CBAFECD|nr:4Fe-4S cluster-binding domain-containing protein [Lawsonia intracellularis]
MDTIFSDIKKKPLIHGVTFSGGEPFFQSNSLANLAKQFKVIGYLLSYTGFLFEELLTDNN